MKGIAHFAAGVTVASCFPEAVRAALQGNPLYFLLGGVFGLLPDTLDFKFVRFFFRHHMEVQPDPNHFDPMLVARAVAAAAQRALDTGRPVRVKLNTVRLGADRWQRYEIGFDGLRRQIAVTKGPVVDTGGNVLEPASADPQGHAAAPILGDLRVEYLAAIPVDIFDGPVFEFRPGRPGGVVAVFIPWHRSWTHSLMAAGVAGLAAGLAWGRLAAAVAAAAVAAHVLVDQAGHMGCSLFYPWRRCRIPGLRWAHSGDAFPNFALVWSSCAVTFWNLARFSGESSPVPHLVRLLVFGLGIPLAVAWWILGARDRLTGLPNEEEEELGVPE